MKNKLTPKDNAHFLFSKSNFAKNEAKKIGRLKANADFIKEYRFLNKNFPIFEGEVTDEYINNLDLERTREGDRLWRNFYEKWGIKRIRRGKIHLKRDISIGVERNAKDGVFYPYIKATSKDATMQDSLDHMPLFSYLKGEYLGFPKKTQGRKKSSSLIKRNQLIKKEYLAEVRTGEYKKKEILSSLARKYKLSTHAIKKIVL